MLPEAVLDRYLRSYEPPLEVRECYPAKQDLERIDPKDLGWILEGVQTAINSRYMNGSVETPLGPLIVHLDFTVAPTGERPAENAVSFVREGYAFLVLSMPIVRRIFEISQEVGLTPTIHGLLGLNPSSTKDRATLMAMLAVVQLQFIALHELGHHVHGHCHNEDERSEPVHEFGDENAQNSRGSLQKQAMELEADCYATVLMLAEILKPPMSESIIAALKPEGVDKNIFLLNFLFVSIASHMFLKLQSDVDLSRIEARTHPPQLARLNFIMREIGKWLTMNHSELAWWAGVPHFQTMMRAVEVCYGESDSPRFWREQGAFLVSAEGQTYLEGLKDERKKLYEQMTPYRWESFLSGIDWPAR
jgi:hypothetical protein